MTPGEVYKSRARREREGWYGRYAPDDRPGIDIGCQHDPLNETFRRYDLIFGDGDATFMAGVPDDKFWTVFASHVLEHVHDPVTALKNWYRIVKLGGHLIVVVPHRDLYERKKTLPSMWNGDHKSFWLPDRAEPPDTRDFKATILAAIPDADIVLFRVLDEGFDYTIPPDRHARGEYSIEAVVRKNKGPKVI